MHPLLTDIFAIADHCSAEEIIETFPIALVDEWGSRQSASNDVKRELASWTANHAASRATRMPACWPQIFRRISTRARMD